MNNLAESSASMKKTAFIKETHSTNNLLREMMREQSIPELFVLRTDFQTAGKGQTGNSWESAKGKNLLFSTVIYPPHIAIENQFIVSQMISIAIKQTLDEYADGFSVKWPNDIYWNDKKIAGILIENSLQAGKIKWMIIGVGLNVNQEVFKSDAPNPVSLKQITGKRQNRKKIIDTILSKMDILYKNINYSSVRAVYSESLYRKNGFYTFRADGETFDACISQVYPDGQLELETKSGEIRRFYFKEVEYVKV